jgi:hypothetical protein
MNPHDFQDEELFVTEAASLSFHGWAKKNCIRSTPVDKIRQRQEVTL